MLHSTSLLPHNNRFVFSFRSKPSFFHSHSLSFSKFLSLPSSSQSSCCHVSRISTETLEVSPPPPPDFNFRREIARLADLRDRLSACSTLNEKLRVIDADSRVKRFFRSRRGLAGVLASLQLSSDQLFLLKCVVAAGQEHVLCLGETESLESSVATSAVKSALYTLADMIENMDSFNGNGGAGFGMALGDHEIAELNNLLEILAEIERFYDCIGGIVGYQITVLELLVQKLFEMQNISWAHQRHDVKECQILGINAPNGLNLSEDTEYASQAALWGIEGLPDLGEIYPLGGSADRLGLVDPNTGECLPAAMLPYCGRTLLEGLIRDLQAREFLYFKLYGKQCITPVAIMTSSAKNNHKHVTSLCERLSWFGRGRSTFQFFEQKLGFASCKRILGATEGVNVLMEKKSLDGNWEYGVSCIEYTEFDKFGITTGPLAPKGLQTEFPANTNILYIDLPSAELVGSSKSETSLPGMVLNTRKPIVYTDQFGRRHSVSGGRLECTMQNIADNYSNSYSSRCYNDVEDKLDTYIVYNERRRVTSSAKKKRRHGDKSLHQTPDGALLDILRNAHDLLSQCDIRLPEIEANENYVDSGPPFLILLHPALGPLWEVTKQKFYGGSISEGSELQIEVAEFFWRNVQLNGSLIIISENVMGSMKINENGESILHYGQRCGRCKLQNVKVLNKGIDWTCGENIYWKHDVQRSEVLQIILHGNAEFEATDVVLQGNHVFEVPDGYKLKITPGSPGLAIKLDPIDQDMMESGSWHWDYKIEGSHIQLELVES
uniref:UGP3-like C-terminal hexapeptide repeats domain-containing protein n=1 Tax=Glycine max TaxID=3847 RepID=A0A0R0F6F4_SOYBN